MPIPLVTRILVADDHPIVRSGLKKVLDAQPDLAVVAEAEDGAEAVEKAMTEDVHVAILDVSMPNTTGIQAAEELHRRKPELRLLMLSMYDSEQFLFESLKAALRDTSSSRTPTRTSSRPFGARCAVSRSSTRRRSQRLSRTTSSVAAPMKNSSTS